MTTQPPKPPKPPGLSDLYRKVEEEARGRDRRRGRKTDELEALEVGVRAPRPDVQAPAPLARVEPPVGRQRFPQRQEGAPNPGEQPGAQLAEALREGDVPSAIQARTIPISGAVWQATVGW